ncbi:Bap31 domain containing protein [Trichuris trichiura]|uniref:Endoplasmic reticulum transmembrane protein n=1 Tax=Trichuris trichiura TaxID=36087 RepID=A0A077ZIX5_TRITR|nr:Bap31 domain containing protein [Trichuris trichiura]
MTLQWTVVAVFLYLEALLLGFLLLPWIRPPIMLLTGSIESSLIAKYDCADGVREVRKYSEADKSMDSQFHTAQADAIVHMRLFRAQRNLYISGFALFLWL